MTQIKQLYKLIENVDKDDTATLDEIDARVWCWQASKEYAGQDTLGNHVYKERADCLPMVGCGSFANGDLKQFTRSIDAQEQIDTEGWMIYIRQWQAGWIGGMDFSDVHFHTQALPTEPLARLHAKLQVVEYERGKG